MNARGVAQEAVSWYLSHCDPFATHAENVKCFLSGPVQAITLSILKDSIDEAPKVVENGRNKKEPEEEKKVAGSWRKYLQSKNANSGFLGWSEPDQRTFDALGRRTKARMEAFLAGVTLAVASERSSSAPTSANSSPAKNENRLPMKPHQRSISGSSDHSFSLVEGLAGFHSMEKGNSVSPVISSLNASASLLRSISSQSSAKSKRPQIREEDLLTRLELYIRSLHRVRIQDQECVLAAEPARAMKARVRAVVAAFIDTVGTVRQQSPVLTKLLQSLTQELLAVDILGENIVRTIHRVVSEYEHQTSFASLAFLSSPENSADQGLTPLVNKYMRYLQQNWKLCESECELERMLKRSLDPQVRHLFKTIEFRSIGHLLEVCQGLRLDLQRIELPPNLDSQEADDNLGNVDAIQQAIRDLQREVITVNGHVLPPVTSRKNLIHLLSQTMNSRTLTAAPPKRTRRKKGVRRAESAPVLSGSGTSESEDFTSGTETDVSTNASSPVGSNAQSSQRSAAATSRRRRSSFRLSTIDLLTIRLLLAAGRTGTGGDAYFVVRDLFGGDDVEVVPSQTLPMHIQSVRQGTIEILVRMSTVTIKCHGSFDVYPKSLVGDCEPLIQVHTTTSETITLQEVRKSDSSSDNGKVDDCSSDEEPAMVLQERKTEKTGWRMLSIRPALYEKVEVWNTPS